MTPKKSKEQVVAELARARVLIDKAEQLPTDPSLRRAAVLAGKAQALLDRGRYDEAIAMLASATELDPTLTERLVAYRRLREKNARTGNVDLVKAINTHLVPTLQSAGFVLEFTGEPVEKWREGTVFRRHGPNGNQFMLVGREKGGGILAVNVMRPSTGGQFKDLDLDDVGLSRDVREYLNQSEAEAVLKRLTFTLPAILEWLNGSR